MGMEEFEEELVRIKRAIRRLADIVDYLVYAKTDEDVDVRAEIEDILEGRGDF